MPHVTGHRDDVVTRGHLDDTQLVEERRTVRGPAEAMYSEEVNVTTGRHWYEFDLAGRINTGLFAVLAVLETLLVLRFTFLAFGANPTTGFVDFIYDVSGWFMEPFEGAFRSRTWDQGIVEVSSLLAMGIYALIFAAFAMLTAAIVPRIGGYKDDVDDRTYRSRRVTHSSSH